MERTRPVFLTIRETARLGILSEHHLRLMQHAGQLPGIKTGRTFRVNVNQLIEILNEESAAAVRRDRNGT